MGWSEAEIVCAKHPDETPQPGICPSCLRERLARIIGKYSTTCDSVFPSSPSASALPVYYYGCYSASSSACSSPARGRSQRRRHLRVASDVMDSIYVALGGAGNGLKKSRSMANYAPARDDGVNKKKGGFWNKLMLRSSGKKSKFW